MRPAVLILLMLLAPVWGCREDAPTPLTPDPEPDPSPEPSPELVSGCFSWPEEDFTPDNFAPLSAALSGGEAAVDFTLRNAKGTPYTLSVLLETKPVLLVLGSFT